MAAAEPFELKPVYTTAELARALGFRRKRDGYPDADRCTRWLRALGVDVLEGRPRTVLLDDLEEHAPRLLRLLRRGPVNSTG